MAATSTATTQSESSTLTTLLVSYNTEALLKPCLDALRLATTSVQSSKVIAVDNASRDASVATLQREHPEVQLIVSPVNVGFGRANNLALPLIRSRYVLLLNTDAFVPPDGIEGPLAFMSSHPDCGILGVRLVGRDGELQPSCRYFPTPLNQFASRTGLLRKAAGRMVDDMAWDHATVRECDWVPGCYYLVRREVIEQVGLFDPRYFLYFEEVDHCLSTKKAGWKVFYYPHVSVIHLGGESAKSDGALSASGRQLAGLQTESALLFFRKSRGIAGVTSFLALDLLADLLLWLNAWRRRRGSAVRGELSARMRRSIRIAFQTRMGMRSTR